MKIKYTCLVFIISCMSLLHAKPEFVNYLADNRLNQINDLITEGEIIWIATENGVIKRNNEGNLLKIITTEDGLAANKVKKIAIDASHNKWFATENGVSKYDGKDWTNYRKEHGLVSNYITALCVDHNDKKWFGSCHGVSCFNDTNWVTYTKSDGLVDNDILSIAIDSENNTWFGTNGYGVSKLTDTTWVTYTDDDVLLNNYITDIVLEPNNTLLFISHLCDSITRYDGAIFSHISFYDG